MNWKTKLIGLEPDEFCRITRKRANSAARARGKLSSVFAVCITKVLIVNLIRGIIHLTRDVRILEIPVRYWSDNDVCVAACGFRCSPSPPTQDTPPAPPPPAAAAAAATRPAVCTSSKTSTSSRRHARPVGAHRRRRQVRVSLQWLNAIQNSYFLFALC